MDIDNKENMEDRIIEAAKIVFVRKGYEATKMGDIATEVGISRTALHYYFRTKEMLFEAIFGQLMGTLLPNIDIIVREDTTVLEKLPLILEEYISAIQNNTLFPIFVVNEMNRDPEHLYKAVLKNSNKIQPIILLKKKIKEEMEQGLLKKRPLIEIISTLVGLIVFPLLVQHTLTTLFLEGNKEAFRNFLTERKKLIYDIMYFLMVPDKI